MVLSMSRKACAVGADAGSTYTPSRSVPAPVAFNARHTLTRSPLGLVGRVAVRMSQSAMQRISHEVMTATRRVFQLPDDAGAVASVLNSAHVNPHRVARTRGRTALRGQHAAGQASCGHHAASAVGGAALPREW